jgi:hypothetical protein
MVDQIVVFCAQRSVIQFVHRVPICSGAIITDGAFASVRCALHNVMIHSPARGTFFLCFQPGALRRFAVKVDVDRRTNVAAKHLLAVLTFVVKFTVLQWRDLFSAPLTLF